MQSKIDADKEAVGEYPSEDERSWLAAAVIAFIFSCVAFIGAAFWTFSSEGQVAVFKAQAFAPFGIALGAIVTFFTVVWRGIISTKQLRLQSSQLAQQVDQLAQIVRQNDAKEDENLLKMLQDGARFIAETDKPQQVLVGVASLEVLITNDRQRKYSVAAADILATYYAKHYQKNDDTSQAVNRALLSAESNGVSSTIAAEFVHDAQTQFRPYFWPLILGFRRQSYRGGYMSAAVYRRLKSSDCDFTNVHFLGCRDVTFHVFNDCTFTKCSFSALSNTDLSENTFRKCDFSGCDFDSFSLIGGSEVADLRSGENYFYDDNPPRFWKPIDWESIFLKKQREVPAIIDAVSVDKDEHQSKTV